PRPPITGAWQFFWGVCRGERRRAFARAEKALLFPRPSRTFARRLRASSPRPGNTTPPAGWSDSFAPSAGQLSSGNREQKQYNFFSGAEIEKFSGFCTDQ